MTTVRSRFAAPLIAVYVLAVMPVLAFAQEEGKVEKPEGHDYTLDTIFVVALGIPAILVLLSLIDLAVGRRSRSH
jgi:hypothetical protein